MEFLELSRVNLLIIVGAAMLVNACSITAPFVDRRREAGVSVNENLYIGASTPKNPAICYNALTTPYSEVLKLATEECRKHKTGAYAIPKEQTTFTCRLFIPNHFYFECVK